LTINGEKSTSMLAAMVRVIWLAEHLPTAAWTGTNATVTNHQIVATLAQHPRLREFVCWSAPTSRRRSSTCWTPARGAPPHGDRLVGLHDRGQAMLAVLELAVGVEGDALVGELPVAAFIASANSRTRVRVSGRLCTTSRRHEPGVQSALRRQARGERGNDEGDE
jgi:hypothetical protein